MINDTLFMQKFIKEPKKAGSIIPSSSFLTRRMVEALPCHYPRGAIYLNSINSAVFGCC